MSIGMRTLAPALVLAVLLPTSARADEDRQPQALIEQLGARKFAERQAATEALVALGAKAVPALLAALTHADPEIRTRTRFVLERLVGELPLETIEAEPTLRAIARLREVRELLVKLGAEGDALSSFGHFQGPESFLESHPEYQRLIEIGRPAVPAIIEAASQIDADPAVNYQLLVILGETGDPRALTLIVSLLGSEISFMYGAG